MMTRRHRYAALHDAELVSVGHEKRSGKVSIKVICSDDSEETLILHGVKTIRVVDFISQNVISRVLHSEESKLDVDDLTRMVAWANSLSDGTCLISQDAIANYVSQIQARVLKIIAVEPSWGAELVCIYGAGEG